MDYAIVISCQKAAYVLHKLNWAHVDREWRRKMFPSTEQLKFDFWSVTVWIPIAVLYNLALSWLAKTCLAQCLVQWMTLFREMCMFCWSFIHISFFHSVIIDSNVQLFQQLRVLTMLIWMKQSPNWTLGMRLMPTLHGYARISFICWKLVLLW